MLKKYVFYFTAHLLATPLYLLSLMPAVTLIMCLYLNIQGARVEGCIELMYECTSVRRLKYSVFGLRW